ncbi:MAG: Glu-tRNA(Gln) amidotransferase subunit GatD [Candidatus Micrarchaeia archaeon]
MYDKATSSLLQTLGIKIGDYVRFEKKGAKPIEGMLLMRPESGDTNCLVLKLSTGYNIGINPHEGALEKTKSGKTQEKIGGQAVNMAGTLKKDSLHLISTGGTISSRIDYQTGAVHPQIDASGLVKLYPRLEKFEPIFVRSIFSVLSENMNPTHWTQMAQAVKESFDDGARGVVIAHGTDTMGYSAAALSYALDGLGAPVILTGAQRSPDRASSDAAQNMFCSMAAAGANFSGVYLCMHASTNDDINHLHFGTRVRKSHTSGRWAFKSVGAQPAAQVNRNAGEIKFFSELPGKNLQSKIILKNKFSQNVHLAWAYPGISPKTISSWSEYDGVVVAGTGLGHLPADSRAKTSEKTVLSEIKQLVDSGVVVAMAPQALEGRVMLETYSSGRLLEDAGIIGNGADWLAETAYVKLCWALGQSKDFKKACELMMTPMHNDISEFSAVNTGE